jgi:hypothetical protein
MFVRSLSRDAMARSMPSFVREVLQRVFIRGSQEVDRTAIATVSTLRATTGDKLFSTKR